MWKRKERPVIPRVALDRDIFAARHIEHHPGQVWCGADALPGEQLIDRELVLMIAESRSAKWKWCPECAMAFTGEPRERFIEGEINE